MDFKDFEKAGNQLKLGYKRQLQDLLVQGFTFFDYDFVEDCFQEVVDAVSDTTNSDLPEEESNSDIPF